MTNTQKACLRVCLTETSLGTLDQSYGPFGRNLTLAASIVGSRSPTDNNVSENLSKRGSYTSGHFI